MTGGVLARILVGLILPLMLCSAAESWAETEAWDRDVLATVNGHPIERSVVENILNFGALPDSYGYSLKSLATRPVLEQLILEQLILESATQNHIQVEKEDVNRYFADLMLDKSGLVFTDEEQGKIKIVLERQLLVRKMTGKIMDERQVLSAKEWQKYWDGWPRAKVPRYQVQVVLVPLTVDISKLDLSNFSSVEGLDSYFMEQAVVALLSGPMWLAGADQDPALIVALENAFELGKLAEARPLTESWAFYEVLKVERMSDPLEDYRQARTSFESLAREKAFGAWLAERRAQSDIRIGPFSD